MNIEEISKELTREEFFDNINESDVLVYKDERFECPSHLGIDKDKCDLSCKECWKQAVEDIQFKSEEKEEKLIDKLSKELTKEEFLDCFEFVRDGVESFHYKDIVRTNHTSVCPCHFQDDLEEICPTNCKECWKNAIKNIEFKNEDKILLSKWLTGKTETLTEEEFLSDDQNTSGSGCPDTHGLENYCSNNTCTECWRKAIEESDIEFKKPISKLIPGDIDSTKEQAKTMEKEEFIDLLDADTANCPDKFGLEKDCGGTCEECVKYAVENSELVFKDTSEKPSEVEETAEIEEKVDDKTEFLCIKDFHMESGKREYTAGHQYEGKKREDREGSYYIIDDSECEYHSISPEVIKEYFIIVEESFDTAKAFSIVSTDNKAKCKRIGDGLILSQKNGFYNWESGHKFLAPNDKWILVKEEPLKEVSFEEAVKAYQNEGKVIECHRGEDIFIYKGDTIGIQDQDNRAICADEILNGTWYIRE